MTFYYGFFYYAKLVIPKGDLLLQVLRRSKRNIKTTSSCAFTALGWQVSSKLMVAIFFKGNLKRRPPILRLKECFEVLAVVRKGEYCEWRHQGDEQREVREKEVEQLGDCGHKMVDFIADYYNNIENFPVLSQVQKKVILVSLIHQEGVRPILLKRHLFDTVRIVGSRSEFCYR
ncbi:hypothetical protein BUALT_Bualt04G0094400 [Buddleja alternifolia]|uniref:LAGLIDADG homing endonuclease n=1 Tax=Buddleja alternifolia TaxID=168488 RepID=A0AAV6XUB6_9LAMI|nr:hypothetical protein BUALT_Bualt04G0094400 [Buddleja alternifolia]